MTPGVEITDRVTGKGEPVGSIEVITAQVRMFLQDGHEIFGDHRNQEHIIYLGKRHTIAGLRYGIQGMRVGGVREISIKPELAYGEAGVPGLIPQNAELRCEVKLLKVRPPVDAQPVGA